MNKTKLAYIEFIDSKKWDYFSTLTTQYNLNQKAARSYITTLSKFLKKYKTKIFWVFEPFNTKGGGHLHLLIKMAKPSMLVINSYKTYFHTLWQKISKKDWQKEENRTETVKFNPKLRGSEYVTKYINSPKADYDFHF